MIITKTCNTCEHFPNDKHCIGCEWDKSKGENSKWELKKNPIVIERVVLDKISKDIKKAIDDCDSVYYTSALHQVLDIIDKYTK